MHSLWVTTDLRHQRLQLRVLTQLHAEKLLNYKAEVLMYFTQACVPIRECWVHYPVQSQSAKQRIGNRFPRIICKEFPVQVPQGIHQESLLHLDLVPCYSLPFPCGETAHVVSVVKIFHTIFEFLS